MIDRTTKALLLAIALGLWVGLADGVLCAPFLPKPKVSGLMFHKDAFAFDWPAIEAGYFYRSQDVACTVEEFAERCRPHLEAAQRQLAEVIDRG